MPQAEKQDEWLPRSHQWPVRKGKRRDADKAGSKYGRRRRKKRTADLKPRPGKVGTEFTKVKGVEFMRATIAPVDVNSLLHRGSPRTSTAGGLT